MIIRWAINAVALYAAIALVPGLQPTNANWLSYVWLALIFGLVHIEPWFLFGLVGLGLLLAYVYDRTRSLVACIVLHAVHNGVSLALMFQQGGMVDADSVEAPIDWPFLTASTAALIAVLWLIQRRGARRL